MIATNCANFERQLTRGISSKSGWSQAGQYARNVRSFPPWFPVAATRQCGLPVRLLNAAFGSPAVCQYAGLSSAGSRR